MAATPFDENNIKVFRGWYRILLYIGGTILIISLFIEPIGLKAIYVVTFSAWSLLIGLLIWLIEDCITVIWGYYFEKNKKGKFSTRSLSSLFTAITYFRYFIHVIAFIIWAVFVFPVLFYS